MADKPDPLNSFFSKVRSLFESAPAQEPSPAPQAPVPGPGRPRPVSRGTDTFRRTQGQLTSTQTTPLQTGALEQTEEARAQESQRRMAFVLAFLQDSDAVPQLKDSRFVYKLVSDERAYQTDLFRKAEGRLRELLAQADPAAFDDPQSPPSVAREELEAELQAIRDIQTQLFMVLKKVTGKRGHTGGTGFFPPSNEPGDKKGGP